MERGVGKCWARCGKGHWNVEEVKGDVREVMGDVERGVGKSGGGKGRWAVW